MRRLPASLFSLFLILADIASAARLSSGCRKLLTCAVSAGCIKVNTLEKLLDRAAISENTYDIAAENIDYACIFNTGCNEECNSCPLCLTAKEQLTDILSGETRAVGNECYESVNCASACVLAAGTEVHKMVDCLLYSCAFYCFNGSCPKCSAFTTRVWNQACVSANLRSRVIDFQGQCHDMFRQIVYQKFRKQFDGIGRLPSVGAQH